MPAVDVAGDPAGADCGLAGRVDQRDQMEHRQAQGELQLGIPGEHDVTALPSLCPRVAVLREQRVEALSLRLLEQLAGTLRVGRSQRVYGVDRDALEHAVLATLARRHGRAARSAAHEDESRRAVALLVHEVRRAWPAT